MNDFEDSSHDLADDAANYPKFAEPDTLAVTTAEEDLARGYSEGKYWRKLMRFARVAGKEVVEKTLWLYYAAQDDKVPAWARTVIYSALAYFIIPTDAIPDFTPAVGYADDLGAIMVALTTVAAYITPQVKRQAAAKMRDWFGEDELTQSDDR